MTNQRINRGKGGAISALWLSTLSLGAMACEGTTSTNPHRQPTAGSGGQGAGGSAGTGGVPQGCDSAPKLVPQRIVRLSYSQLEHSIQAVLGGEALEGAVLEDPKAREFQALFTEGRSINLDVLRKTVGLAELASGNALAAFMTQSGCAATDEACLTSFLGTFAARVYRRPVAEDEKASMIQLYTELKAAFASSASGGMQEAVRYTLEGLLSAPGAIYRTELGHPDAAAVEAVLTPNEVADLLAFTLTNAPPDQALLDAAAANVLSNEAEIAAQVDRLLQTPAARDNLTAVLMAYYGLNHLSSTRKDPDTYPAFTVGLQNSMYAETQKFTANVLWSGKLDDLLTSRTTFVNDGLAALYGVTYPGPPGGDFMQVELPEGQRAGLLTQPSILATKARTKNTSVVARGLFVNGEVLCIPKPPPPPSTVQAQVDAQLMNDAETERQKADYRGKTSPCLGCHANFDPFGLVLENYDGIGRYRSEYAAGVPVDATTTLPTTVGGGTAASVTELVSKVTASGAFSSCITANLMKYALTDDAALDYKDCGVKRAHDEFLQGGQTFSELMRHVLTSKTLTTRGVVKE